MTLVFKHIFKLRIILIVVLMSFFLMCCAGFRPNITIPKTMPKPLKVVGHPQVVLVLGGGGARGYAHLGVLHVLQQAGVPIDMIVGASAGSIVGALYADTGNANKVIKIMMHAGFWSFADITNIPNLKGIMEGYHLEKFLLRNMRARNFSQLKIPLIVATTDLNTGKTISISSGPIAPAVEASAAIPGVIQPAHLYGYTLIDGGMSDPVPVNIAKRYHPKIIIAVNIGRQLSKHKPTNAFAIYERGYQISWQHLNKLGMHDANIIIRPKVGATSVFNIAEKRSMYNVGVLAAKKELPKILKLLSQKHIKLRHISDATLQN